ncbi:MAG: hypothetical protein AABX07_00720 [Nanoarchaeota archaeon]
MVSLTLSIPEDLRAEMGSFPEINWSVIAREAIIKRLTLLKRIKEFSKDSELTEDDAIRIGREINRGIAKKHLRK